MDAILSYEDNPDEDYYKILGCDELSNTEQILTEYKAQVLTCHPDKHPDDSTAATRFERLQRAKETLADPEKRACYDQWRRSGIAMKFEAWRGLRDTMHVSMHWAGKKPQPALKSTDVQDPLRHPADSSPDKLASESLSSALPSWQPLRQTDVPKTARVFWDRDPASIQLQRFRNYDI